MACKLAHTPLFLFTLDHLGLFKNTIPDIQIIQFSLYSARFNTSLLADVLSHSRTSAPPMLWWQLQQQFLRFLEDVIHGIPVPEPDHLPVPHAPGPNASGVCQVMQRLYVKFHLVLTGCEEKGDDLCLTFAASVAGELHAPVRSRRFTPSPWCYQQQYRALCDLQQLWPDPKVPGDCMFYMQICFSNVFYFKIRFVPLI